MIALLGGRLPVRGAGKRVAELAFGYVRNITAYPERVGVTRAPALALGPDDRCLTISTASQPHAPGRMVASLTAMNVWDLVELDDLEHEMKEWGAHG